MSGSGPQAKAATSFPKTVVPGAILLALIVLGTTTFAAEKAPAVGDTAKEFELMGLDGKSVSLTEQVKNGNVVLVVLRGYPGYQCPLCTRQVGELISKAADFQKAGAQVLLVYPGPAKNMNEHAKEFATGKEFPENFKLLLDPDYTFTRSYGLRWNAAGETAYPSTFVIDSQRMIKYAKVSTQHGDRAPVDEVLKAVAK